MRQRTGIGHNYSVPSQINTITLERLSGWEPQGTVVAFLGADAALHATLHGAAIASLVPLKPELAGWNMVAVDVQTEKLAEAFKLLHAKKIWGLVFTQPLKSAALKVFSPAFTEIKEGESPVSGFGGAEANAERVGAVNLALWRPNGYWGLSTDGSAITWALNDWLNLKFQGKTVFIIGAGAFGRATAVEALTQGCRELWIGNRTQDHAWDALDQVVPSPNMRARTHTYNLIKPSPKVPKNGVIVNTLPMNVRQSDTAVVGLERFDKSCFYFDTALTSTAACATADKLEMKFAHGQRMFAWQIVKHIELLTGGATPDLEMVLWAINEAVTAQASPI